MLPFVLVCYLLIKAFIDQKKKLKECEPKEIDLQFEFELTIPEARITCNQRTIDFPFDISGFNYFLQVPFEAYSCWLCFTNQKGVNINIFFRPEKINNIITGVIEDSSRELIEFLKKEKIITL